MSKECSEERVGEIRKNQHNSIMKIIKYNSYLDIIVEFQDKYKVKVPTNYGNFKKGMVRNPYDKTVYDVGYFGIGKYSIKNHRKIYDVWNKMLQRCYDPYHLNKYLTYRDCIVCEEWHNFQNFARWYEENYYEVKNEKMHLDKDILYKGNKIYSPKTCVFVPNRINTLFIKSDKIRGEYPIGCSYFKRTGNIYVQCSILDENKKKKRKHLGEFPLDKPFQAFTIYKNFKEDYIKQVADEYKDLIPQKLYKAMYEYKIEIND